ncbi:MAG TPA: VacJ family lipoprotein, partial [Burkholderiaceae bacterium]|nr:VacJ family lipoprotein [Burkholderiaceae bacterium]
KYTFVRDAYLQRRRSLVFDGDVPETPSPPDEAASAPAGAAEGNLAPPAAATPASAPSAPPPASAPGAASAPS